MSMTRPGTEVIQYFEDFPFRIFIHSLDCCKYHMHKELELLLVLKGSIHLMVFGNTYTVSQGEVAVISENAVHSTVQSDQPNVVLALQINTEKMGLPKSSIENIVFEPLGGNITQRTIIRSKMCMLYIETIYHQKGYRTLSTGMLWEICGMILRHIPAQEIGTAKITKEKDRERTLRIIDYINQHSHEKISLADIARQEYLSVSYLSTVIRKAIGVSFVDYLNSVRLKRFLEKLQVDSASSLGEISQSCGFSSIQFANTLMKKTYQITLGQYRKNAQMLSMVKNKLTNAKMDVNYDNQYKYTDLSLLNPYLTYLEYRPAIGNAEEAQIIQIHLDRKPVNRYHGSATKIASVGRAYEVLLAPNQKQIEKAKKEIGFTGLHFHGIFSDEMMVVKADETGALHFSFNTTDAILDYLLSIGLTPYIEFTYMPTMLASGTETVFAYRGNITPPANMEAWSALVSEFVRHCVKRYGRREVMRWVFEVWNEPDFYRHSWTGGEKGFHELYVATVRAVHSVLSNARIAGPSVTLIGLKTGTWLPAFEAMCKRENLRVDMLSLHAYPELFMPDTPWMTIVKAGKTANHLMSPEYLGEIIGMARKQHKSTGNVPFLVSEWNITAMAFNPINDSAFAASSLIHSALQADAADVLLVHWTLLDNMGEHILPPQEFHGGFGLVSVNGINKPSYYAMQALSRMRPDIIHQSENLLITKEGNSYQILAYNHPKTQKAYDIVYGQDVDSGFLRKYDIFTAALHLSGTTLQYSAHRYLYDAAFSSKEIMREKGMKEPLQSDETDHLKRVSGPAYKVEKLEKAETIRLSICLSPCSFEFIELIPAD
jgi:xylan 1,4-beta-xylosidase